MCVQICALEGEHESRHCTRVLTPFSYAKIEPTLILSYPPPPRKKKTGCNVKRGLLSSETWGAIEYSAKQDKGCVAPEEIARGVTRASAGRVGSGVGLGLPGDSPVL